MAAHEAHSMTIHPALPYLLIDDLDREVTT
jgi:hypothetical protein